MKPVVGNQSWKKTINLQVYSILTTGLSIRYLLLQIYNTLLFMLLSKELQHLIFFIYVYTTLIILLYVVFFIYMASFKVLSIQEISSHFNFH